MNRNTFVFTMFVLGILLTSFAILSPLFREQKPYWKEVYGQYGYDGKVSVHFTIFHNGERFYAQTYQCIDPQKANTWEQVANRKADSILLKMNPHE